MLLTLAVEAYGDACRCGARPTAAVIRWRGSLALLAATIVVSALAEAAERKPHSFLSHLYRLKAT
jgi:hypothetical protein